MKLLDRTYDLVSKTKLSQRQIAAGAGVGRDWFAKFAQKKIRSPGVDKVERVYNFLARRRRTSVDTEELHVA